jgi:hypothetical protein
MTQRDPLTVAQRESIYRSKLNGQSLAISAKQQHCSYGCVRKWWRTGRDQGLDGLHRTGRVRSAPGVLSTFDPVIAERTLHWKRQHPHRGPTRILQDLADDAVVADRRLPKRSTVANYFQSACPELIQRHQSRPGAPDQPKDVHELWQMDGKENIRLKDGTIATTLDIREPVACIFLGSSAHAVETDKAWRKLTLPETQTDLRSVFTVFGLPRGIQTDREALYGQPAAEAFPSVFTLWLVGLGIHHAFSRPNQPTDQPHVERGHRTLFDWMARAEPPRDLATLQGDLDTARHMHNAVLPSQAGNCQGQVPVQVHPEVLQSQRPYHPSAELDLFSLDRVDAFLSQFTWQYKVTSVGQITVQGYRYGVGSAHAGKQVDVRFDLQDRSLVFMDAQSAQELKRCSAQGLDITTITGLDVPPPTCPQPVQLSFPW